MLAYLFCKFSAQPKSSFHLEAIFPLHVINFRDCCITESIKFPRYAAAKQLNFVWEILHCTGYYANYFINPVCYFSLHF